MQSKRSGLSRLCMHLQSHTHLYHCWSNFGYHLDFINSDVNKYYTSINITHNSSSYLIPAPIPSFSADNEQLFVTTCDTIVMTVFVQKKLNRNIICLAMHKLNVLRFRLVFTRVELTCIGWFWSCMTWHSFITLYFKRLIFNVFCLFFLFFFHYNFLSLCYFSCLEGAAQLVISTSTWLLGTVRHKSFVCVCRTPHADCGYQLSMLNCVCPFSHSAELLL